MRRSLLLLFYLLISVSVFSQTKTITGRITDIEGKPLPGVNVVVENTNTGTVTGVDGNYSINAGPNDTLVFSFVGYLSEEILVNQKSTIDLRMVQEITELDEIVVIGYGTQKVRDVTGAISTMKQEKIERLPVSTLDQAMQGNLSGVHVTSNSGSPGSPISVLVRGMGTVRSNEPLYVVDGVPVGNIEFLNPGDISSLEVLKDAGTAAIYGTRAANGVVLITTKKGEKGETVVSYNTFAGFQNLYKGYNNLGGKDYAIAMNRAMDSDIDAYAPNPDNVDRSSLYYFDPDTVNTSFDYLDLIQNENALIHNHQFSLSGGGENGRYAFSAGYFEQEGIIKKSDYQRMTLRSNLDTDITSNLKFGNSLNYAYTDRTPINENDNVNGLIATSIFHDPVTPPVDENGNYIRAFNGVPNTQAIMDALNIDLLGHSIVGSSFAEWKPLDVLSIRSTIGVDLRFNERHRFFPTYFVSEEEQNEVNRLTIRNENSFNWVWSNIVTYNNTFAQNNEITILGGYTIEQNKFELRQASKDNFPNNDPSLRYFNSSLSESGGATGEGFESSMISYLARILYSYKSKYLLSANVRIDGSSKFGSNYRYGQFPGITAGWKVTEEPFMSGISNIVSFLKIRAGYGTVGNDEIPPYAYVPSVMSPDYRWYAFGKDSRIYGGAAPATIANENLRWETSIQQNIGFNSGFFDNQLLIDFDYYKKTTEDMLVRVPTLVSLGLEESPYVNGGTVENSGIEIRFNFRKKYQRFSFDIDANFFTLNNEVVSLGEGGEPLEGANFQGNALSRTEVGHPIASFYGYEVENIFQTEAEIDEANQNSPTGVYQTNNTVPGDFKFKDLSGPDGIPDGRIDENDKNIIGNPHPRIMYGVTFNFTYLRFDFSAFFQGVKGNDIYNSIRYYTAFGLNNLHTDRLSAWEKEGDQTSEPRLTFQNQGNIFRPSDYFIEEGSYLRLKNIQLGYNFISGVLNTIGFSNLRIYISAQNLLTFTGYSGMEPEIGKSNIIGFEESDLNIGGPLERGLDRGIYPQPRTILMGLNVTF